MTQAELDAWVARISYKPGWQIAARVVAEDKITQVKIVQVTAGFHAHSSEPPYRDRGVFHSRCAVLDGNFDSFLSDVIQTVHELENHETREWFKCDGEQWLKPHNSRAIFVVL